MPGPLSRRVVVITILALVMAAAWFVFRGGSWPPSPEELLRRDGFSWRRHETKDFWIHYEAGSFAEKELKLLVRMHEMAMPGLLELIGESAYPRKIHIFAVEDRARMKALIGTEGNGQALVKHHAIVGVFSEQTKAGGAHELMHVVSNNRWGVVSFRDRAGKQTCTNWPGVSAIPGGWFRSNN
ncbi:MAG: hypothetical protein AB1705_28200 [Verrucomicrobiota bacterium]